MRILRQNDLVDMPWKNGGGITRNIATGMNGPRLAWRISRADVKQDGAFSNFAGLRRILTVVTQNTMTLTSPRGDLQAKPLQPLHFDGGLAIFARLMDGPLTDLNLMFDPLQCVGSAEVRNGRAQFALHPPKAGLIALHGLAGMPRIGGQTLASGDTAFLDGSTEVHLAEADALLEIKLLYSVQKADIKLTIAQR